MTKLVLVKSEDATLVSSTSKADVVVEQSIQNTDAEKFKAFVELITANPSLLPASFYGKLKMEVLRDMVRDSANDAQVKLFSEIKNIEEDDPVEAYMTSTIVEAWLLVHGKRMIDDKAVSETIRQQLVEESGKKEIGRFQRAILAFRKKDEKTRTELIKQSEALAGENDLVRRDNERVRAENKRIHEEAQEYLMTSQSQGASIVTEATSNAQQIIRDARQEAQSLINSATLEAEERVTVAASRLNILNEEFTRLTREVAKLHAVEQRLLKDPHVEWAYRLENEVHKGQFEERLSRSISTIRDRLEITENNSYNAESKRVYLAEALSLFYGTCLDDLAEFQRQYSRNDQTDLIARIIEQITWIRGESFVYVDRPKQMFTTVLQAILKGVSASEIKKVFAEVIDSFVDNTDDSAWEDWRKICELYSQVIKRVESMMDGPFEREEERINS